MSKKMEVGQPSQEPVSRKTLSYDGNKADWEAEAVTLGAPPSGKVIAYALLKEAELEAYQPTGGETGFVDKVAFKHTGKRTPTLRLAMEKNDHKTKHGHDGQEAPAFTKEQEVAMERLNAYIRQEGESWRDLKQDEGSRLGRHQIIAKTLEKDKDFVVRQMSRVAEEFLKFADQYGSRIKQGADRLYYAICRREGADDELIIKSWAMALNKRFEAQPKPKKSGSIRSV